MHASKRLKLSTVGMFSLISAAKEKGIDFKAIEPLVNKLIGLNKDEFFQIAMAIGYTNEARNAALNANRPDIAAVATRMLKAAKLITLWKEIKASDVSAKRGWFGGMSSVSSADPLSLRAWSSRNPLSTFRTRAFDKEMRDKETLVKTIVFGPKSKSFPHSALNPDQKNRALKTIFSLSPSFLRENKDQVLKLIISLKPENNSWNRKGITAILKKVKPGTPAQYESTPHLILTDDSDPFMHPVVNPEQQHETHFFWETVDQSINKAVDKIAEGDLDKGTLDFFYIKRNLMMSDFAATDEALRRIDTIDEIVRSVMPSVYWLPKETVKTLARSGALKSFLYTAVSNIKKWIFP